MGKSKKQKQNLSSYAPYRKGPKNNKPQAPTESRPQTTLNRIPQRPPTIPFSPTDRIVLVGEGDFSFTYSLYSHHGCSFLVATCYDSATELAEKYPQSADYIRDLEDATCDDEDVDIKILYDVDATKLGKSGPAGGGKALKKGGIDKMVFNFPHVGGLTKDVNRQVRHNQGTIPPYVLRKSDLERDE